MRPSPVEHFPALSAIPGVRHAFTLRHPGLDLQVDREAALQLLEGHHQAALHGLGLAEKKFVTATQVHGADVSVVLDCETSGSVGACDGLITACRDVVLGIYVADCCAVYLVDPRKQVIGLLHSGKKGTEQAISQVAIGKMREQFGCNPTDIVAQLSPCIRPPNYEIDFAAEIIRQCRAAGVENVADSGQCTGADPETYYSYRMERGRTGRMLALLALD